jgi:hypothetical protein
MVYVEVGTSTAVALGRPSQDITGEIQAIKHLIYGFTSPRCFRLCTPKGHGTSVWETSVIAPWKSRHVVPSKLRALLVS